MQISWLDFFRDLPVVTLIVSLLWLLLSWERPAVVLSVLLVLSLVLVRALKLIFRAKRPSRSRQGDPAAVGVEVQDDLYGMPSGHSTIAFAFFSFATVHLLTRRPSVMSTYSPLRRNLVWGVTVPLFVVAPFLVAYQRVAARRHTLAQVIVGGAIGATLGTTSALFLAR